MELKIGQFYRHPDHPVLRFSGYTENGLLMFDRWDRWNDGRWQFQNRLTVQNVKTQLKEIPPPA